MVENFKEKGRFVLIGLVMVLVGGWLVNSVLTSSQANEVGSSTTVLNMAPVVDTVELYQDGLVVPPPFTLIPVDNGKVTLSLRGTVHDNNGLADYGDNTNGNDSVRAVFYRTGTDLNGAAIDANCTPDKNYCYETTCNLTDVGGGDIVSRNYECSFEVASWIDLTTDGDRYPSEAWVGEVIVTDTAGETANRKIEGVEVDFSLVVFVPHSIDTEDEEDSETDEDGEDSETDEDGEDSETDEDGEDSETDEDGEDSETDEDGGKGDLKEKEVIILPVEDLKDEPPLETPVKRPIVRKKLSARESSGQPAESIESPEVSELADPQRREEVSNIIGVVVGENNLDKLVQGDRDQKIKILDQVLKFRKSVVSSNFFSGGTSFSNNSGQATEATEAAEAAEVVDSNLITTDLFLNKQEQAIATIFDFSPAVDEVLNYTSLEQTSLEQASSTDLEQVEIGGHLFTIKTEADRLLATKLVDQTLILDQIDLEVEVIDLVSGSFDDLTNIFVDTFVNFFSF